MHRIAATRRGVRAACRRINSGEGVERRSELSRTSSDPHPDARSRRWTERKGPFRVVLKAEWIHSPLQEGRRAARDGKGTMKLITEMPLFLRISLSLLAVSMACGQIWLHRDVPPASAAAAREAIASCPVLGRPGEITSRWDVIRAHDRVWMRRILSQTGFARPC